MRFHILGPLQVHDPDGRPCALDPRQARILAVLLLAAKQTVSRQQLIDDIWDDGPPATADRQVQNCISALRRRVTRTITTEHSGYRIQVDAGQLDAQLFADQLGEAQALASRGQQTEAATRLRAALSLWQGQALSGLTGRAITAAAARLDEQRLTAIELCLDLELQLRREHEIVGELTELVATHPLRERLVGQLMRAHYRCGRQADALAAYERLRTRLADELGLDPGPELRELRVAILRNDVAGSPPVRGALDMAVTPRQLPSPPRHFVGRTAELKELTGLADEAGRTGGAVVISAIDGTGGIGKTALALRWAHRVAARFPDGQLYANLRGFDPSGTPTTPAEVMRAFLDAFAVPPERIPASLPAQAALYRSLIAGRRILIVLDNVRDVEQVRPLLPGSATCLTVLTSRSRLTGLVATEGAHPITLDLLSHAEARELLARHLGPERVAGDSAAADELITRCARLPLALAIVAARAASHPNRPLRTYAAELARAGGRLDALDTGDRTTEARAVFSWSYHRLGAPAARLFRLLGLHPGSDIATATAASLGGEPAAAVRVLLDELTRSHLLAEPAPGRYTCHDLLREYAAELTRAVDLDGEREAAWRRMLDHYLYTADAAARLLYPDRLRLPVPSAPDHIASAIFDDVAAASDWLDAERANLVAAAIHAREQGQLDTAWLLADALRGYVQLRMSTVDWMTTASVAVAAAEERGDPTASAAAHQSLGTLHYLQGHIPQAIEALVRARTFAEAAGWIDGVTAALSTLGNVHNTSGHTSRAIRYYTEALALSRRTGWLTGRANTLANLGCAYWLEGRLDEAIGRHRLALALHRKLGAVYGETLDLGNLGEAQHAQGRLGEALQLHTRALALRRQIGDRPAEAGSLLHIAAVHRDAGRLDQAFATASAAVALTREVEHPQVRSEALNILGSVHRRFGRLRLAREHHQQALVLAREANHRYAEIEAMIELSAAHAEPALYPQAVAHGRAALELARTAGYRLLEGRALTTLATMHLAQGDVGAAIDHAERARAIQRETGHRIGLARTLAVLRHARER